MLDMYYDTEQPFQDDPRLLSRLTRVSHAVVEDILKEFFILIDGKWHNSRADKEILEWYKRSDTARAKADKRWKLKRDNAALIQNTCYSIAVALPQVCCDDATQYPLPITKSKPKVKSVGASATRLPADWKPSDEEINYCKTQRPDLILEKVVENFSDYWHAKGGASARKVDWSATWRSWVRNEKSVSHQAARPTRHDQQMDTMAALTGGRFGSGLFSIKDTSVAVQATLIEQKVV